MIIDSTHRPWIAFTVVIAILAGGFYAVVAHQSPDRLTGGSLIGLWYGIIGSALLVFAGLLAVLKRVPSWGWIGQRQTWLRGHIWFGLLSVLFIICHSGPGLGGPLEIALWIVYALVILSGVFGLILQHVLPRMLTDRVTVEAPFEQIPHICRIMRAKADALVDELCGIPTQPLRKAAGKQPEPEERSRQQLREFYEEEMRPFLIGPKRGDTLLADPLHAEAAFEMLRGLPGLSAAKAPLAELAALCDERRHLAAQERYHALLHGWLLLHVPLSAGLLVLGGVHAFVSMYY